MIEVIDNFLADPEAARSQALRKPFIIEKRYFPEGEKAFVLPRKATAWPEVHIYGDPVICDYKWNDGVHLDPYWVHDDRVCGDIAILIYLNTPEEYEGKDGGLAFYTHKETGAERAWDFKEFNPNPWMIKETEWDVRQFIEMKYNRAVIFDADLFHAAQPVIPFKGRLVQRVFLNADSSQSRVADPRHSRKP